MADDKATRRVVPARPASLAPGESITCTASYTITQANLDAGSVDNTATGTRRDGAARTPTGDGHGGAAPALSLDKSAPPATYDHVGQVIAYSYLVTNTGNVTLAARSRSRDDKASDESCPATASLAPGASITCTASYTITQADLDAGSVTNVASATNGTVTSTTDTATVTAVQSPALSLAKDGTLDMTVVAPSGRVDVGDKVNYTLTATNTGNVTLHGVTIVDAKLGALTCRSRRRSLRGGTLVCTGVVHGHAGRARRGQVDNTATADSTETPPDGHAEDGAADEGAGPPIDKSARRRPTTTSAR